MKTKITAILAILATSVFAFAETNTNAEGAAPEQQQCVQAKECKGQPKFGKRARPQISPEMREAHVQRVLLSLNDEDLAKLAARVAEIQKMTPEQKAEAIKALPKPEFRPAPQGGDKGPKADGKCPKADGKGPQARGHHRGPGPKGKAFPPRGPRGPKCGCGQNGAPVPPPPPAEEAEGAPEAAPEQE